MNNGDETALVCVVDDDASVCRAVSRVLKSAGLEVRAFQSVDAFMHCDIGHRHACVVADARMANGAGIDLPQRLRDCGRNLPVILMTVEDNGRMRAAARSAGAVGCFRKPVDAQALIDAIEWALADPASNARLAQTPERKTT